MSLRSDNLDYCKILRDKILERFNLKKNEKDIINNVVDTLYGNREQLIREHSTINDLRKWANSREEREALRKLRQQMPRLVDIEHYNLNALSKLKNLEVNEEDMSEQFKSLEEKLLNSLNISQTLQQTPQEEPKSLIFDNIEQYYNDYIQHRKTFDKISHSSVKNNNASFRYLKHFIDNETDFSFKFFKEIQKRFQTLPKNFFKYEKYYSLTYKQLLELKEVEEYETLDNKTINTHMNNFSKFFAYLVYEEIIQANPLNDILPLKENKFTNKEEFTEEELNNIFNSDIDVEYKNMCKIALYCGLRIEEVLSIKKENIKDNILYIDLIDTETKKHQRMIPIHNNLKTVISYQNKHNKGIYLFFSGNEGNEVKNVGKRINRRLKDIVKVDKKTFHSFRKNFSQEIELNTTAEEKTKKYLMGHSNSKDITHMVYNRGKINIQKLENCINEITFIY